MDNVDNELDDQTMQQTKETCAIKISNDNYSDLEDDDDMEDQSYILDEDYNDEDVLEDTLHEEYIGDKESEDEQIAPTFLDQFHGDTINNEEEFMEDSFYESQDEENVEEINEEENTLDKEHMTHSSIADNHEDMIDEQDYCTLESGFEFFSKPLYDQIIEGSQMTSCQVETKGDFLSCQNEEYFEDNHVNIDLQQGDIFSSYGDQEEGEIVEDIEEETCSLSTEKISYLLTLEYQSCAHKDDSKVLCLVYI